MDKLNGRDVCGRNIRIDTANSTPGGGGGNRGGGRGGTPGGRGTLLLMSLIVSVINSYCVHRW